MTRGRHRQRRGRHLQRRVPAPGEKRLWLVGGASWLLFVLLLVQVGLHEGMPGPLPLLLGPGMVVLTWLLTSAWVTHNVAIYRRKGARRGRPTVEDAWTHDRLARPLRGSWPRDVRGVEVVVDLVGSPAGLVKLYRAC